MSKLQHWRGFWRHFGLEAAPVLEFGHFVLACGRSDGLAFGARGAGP